jgi:hypothetical protein
MAASHPGAAGLALVAPVGGPRRIDPEALRRAAGDLLRALGWPDSELSRQLVSVERDPS